MTAGAGAGARRSGLAAKARAGPAADHAGRLRQPGGSLSARAGRRALPSTGVDRRGRLTAGPRAPTPPAEARRAAPPARGGTAAARGAGRLWAACAGRAADVRDDGPGRRVGWKHNATLY